MAFDRTQVPSPMGEDDMQSAPPLPAVSFYCGLNLGGYHSTVSASDFANPAAIELEVNDVSRRSTPSVLAFTDRQRLIGEIAVDRLASGVGNGFPVLPNLLGETLPVTRFGPLVSGMKKLADKRFLVENFGAKDWEFAPSQLLAAYIRRMVSFAVDELNRKNGLAHSIATGRYCVSFPDSLLVSEENMREINRACRTGALNCENGLFCGQLTATIACWLTKNLVYLDRKAFQISFFNLGYTETCLSFMECIPASAVTPEMEEAVRVNEFWFVRQLSYDVNSNLGTIDMQRNLAFHIEDEISRKFGVKCHLKPYYSNEVAEDLGVPETKRRKLALRSLEMARKLMEDLSALPIGSITYSTPDDDYHLEVSRETFEEVIVKQFKRNLIDWLNVVVSQKANSVYPLLGCEIVGGGSRIPFIQKSVEFVLKNAFPDQVSETEEFTILRKTLDGSSSASTGATCLASYLVPKFSRGIYDISHDSTVWKSKEDHVNYMAMEHECRSIENEETERLECCNALENRLLEVKGLMNSGIKGTEHFKQDYEDIHKWLEQENGTLAEFKEKFQYLNQLVNTHCHEYHQEQADQKFKKEQEQEADALKNVREPSDYIDTRKMTANQRISLATKNKEEGNELLKDKNFVLAAKRYSKAINHLSLISGELNPEELQRKNTLIGQCNLNLAKTYLITDPMTRETANAAIKACSEALIYDPEYDPV